MRFRSFLPLLAFSAMLLSCGSGDVGLPLLALDAESEVVWEGWTPATLAVDGQEPREAKIHFRGGISSGYPKHSLALKFPERTALCGLPADKDWILNANYIDKTFMRHKLSYDLFRRMNPEANRAPLCAYAMVELDGRPEGLYVVMQKMDASTLGISKGDSSAVVFKEPPVFYEDSIEPQKKDNYYHQTFPKKRKEDRTAQAERLHRFLFESNDLAFHDSVGTLFDLDNIADWHLLLLFSNNSDGMLKNFFLYKADDSTPFRVAPWDYDHSFGRDSDNESNMMVHIIDCDRSVLLRRLSAWEPYRQKLAARWQQLRTDGIVSPKAFARMVEENRSLIAKAVKTNERLWPVDNAIYYDANDFDQELDIMLRFASLSIERMDSLFSDFTHPEQKQITK